MLLKNAVVYDGEFLPVRANVAVEGTLIRSLETPGKSGEGSEALDLSGMTLLPGFIDIHIHGCAGADACDGTPRRWRLSPPAWRSGASPPSAPPP